MRRDRPIRPVFLGLSAAIVVALAGYIASAGRETSVGLILTALATLAVGFAGYGIGLRLRARQVREGGPLARAGDADGPVVRIGWLLAASALAVATASFVVIGPAGTAGQWAAALGVALVVLALVWALAQRVNERRHGA